MTAIFRLATEGVYCGQQWVNVFHYVATEEPPTLPGLLAAFDDGMTSYYESLMAADSVGVILRAWNLATNTYAERAWDMTGARAGGGLPPQNSAVVSWRTGEVGRSHRGRTYFTAISETDQDKGVLGALYLNDLGVLIDRLVHLTVEGSAVYLAVYSRKLAEANIVQNWIARTSIKTQRRREIGVGS